MGGVFRLAFVVGLLGASSFELEKEQTCDASGCTYGVHAFTGNGLLQRMASRSSPSVTSYVEKRAQLSLKSGEAFRANVSLPSGLVGPLSFELVQPPVGLSINKRRATLYWHPDESQVGEHEVLIVVTANRTQHETVAVTLNVAAGQALPEGLYVWPTGGSDAGAGTPEDPFQTIEHAAKQLSTGGTVYVRGGSYNIKETVDVQATPDQPVVITTLPGERVRFTSEKDKNCFYVPESSVGIVFRGLEFDGGSDEDDHWEILRTSWWQTADVRHGAKMAFDIDGQHVTVEECVIQNFAQKAVNVKTGRYVTVKNNVIKNIAHTSLSGGHGIMRQWVHNFGNADNPRYYRWDFYGNLIIAVEQRIYSFIPRKAYCHMVLDEGKGILIDESKDHDMKARVAHNLVLYGGISHIQLKWNRNMEVLNNAALAEEGRIAPTPHGITSVARPNPIPEMTFANNLAQTYAGSFSFDVSHHYPEGGCDKLYDNYFSGGGSDRRSRPGIEDLGPDRSVFRDAAALDFRTSTSLPEHVGIDDTQLQRMMDLAAEYFVSIEPTGWRHDHARMVQVIVDNAPQEHMRFLKVAKSKHDKDKQALWFKVTSREYRRKCNCRKIELIPPEEYWASAHGSSMVQASFAE